jgi:hypothetical protein
MTTSLNLSCRFDRVCYSKDTVVIQNYKTGWKEPDPVKTNSQMRVEAMLVALALGRAGIQPQRFVVQLVTMAFGVFEAEFSWAELAGLYDSIMATLKALESPTAPLRPSREACDNCGAILICSAVKDLVGPIKTLMRKSPIVDETRFNSKRLAANLDEIQILRGYFDAFETYCKESLTAEPEKIVITDGVSVPFSIEGYQITPGAETRAWKDPEAMAKASERLGKLGIIVNGLKTHSPASYLKLYAEHFGRKTEDAKEAFFKLMDGLIEIKNNRPSLKKVKPESRIRELQ